MAEAIVAVGERLGDSDSGCRAAAIGALIQLDAAADFQDEIAELMGDRAPAVRAAAQAAIKTLG